MAIGCDEWRTRIKAKMGLSGNQRITGKTGVRLSVVDLEDLIGMENRMGAECNIPGGLRSRTAMLGELP
jgi:hypothetical protein